MQSVPVCYWNGNVLQQAKAREKKEKKMKNDETNFCFNVNPHNCLNVPLENETEQILPDSLREEMRKLPDWDSCLKWPLPAQKTVA